MRLGMFMRAMAGDSIELGHPVYQFEKATRHESGRDLHFKYDEVTRQLYLGSDKVPAADLIIELILQRADTYGAANHILISTC